MDKKDKAKKVSIQEMYEKFVGEKLMRFGNKLKGKCPFHADNTNPNFFIYLDTNTFNCFAGCGYGDSISFYMRIKDVDFKTAIKEMSK